ncbi:MAG: FtsW/RodA/SpoVE family cell cycle protein, partial [Clostridia bacterium]|nr:FtsW/RodA/SpoVE family cell cycle protein [Clostridia bacterium]
MANQNPKKKRTWFVKKGDAGSIDLVFLILVLCLLTFGLIMLASASYVSALHKYGDSYHYIKRQLIFAVGGVAVMLVFPHVIDYHTLRRFALPLLAVSVILLILVLIPGIGVEVNGARRWLNFGFQFQPSEIAKFALILIFASYMAANYKRMKDVKVGIALPAAVLLLVCGLVAVETHV